MTERRIRGVVAAIATPVIAPSSVSGDGRPDLARLVGHARALLDGGCDALNLLGTTGEATSFDVAQRLAVMRGVAAAGLPLDRFMVGTGAASVADAVMLSGEAAALGFAGALILPPFYYKPVRDDGIVRYVSAIAQASGDVPLYLYNFPAMTGIVYTPALVTALVDALGDRIAGLKDSSGDIVYARAIAALPGGLDVFPSNEGTLSEARSGAFAGCISATANLNADHCAAAFHTGDGAALQRAVAVRALFDGLPLVPGIKHVLSRRSGDAAWKTMVAPLSPLDTADAATLDARIAALA